MKGLPAAKTIICEYLYLDSLLETGKKSSPIGTIISYCTNDFRFIGKCIEEARHFSSQIVIPVCDHFFDGKPENRALLQHTYAQFPDCLFVEFAYLPDRLYSPYHSLQADDSDWAIFWAATARYIGFHYLDAEYLLFLDADEIIEGEKMAHWLNTEEYLAYDAVRMAAYLYALKPTYRAKKVANISLFVKKSTLMPLTLLNPLERMGAFFSHPGPKREKVVGSDGLPFLHHYSWVRTRPECTQKTQTWGHRHDADWPTLIEEAFGGEARQPFDTSLDFGETGKAPYFDPLTVSPPKQEAPLAQGNVIKINPSDLARKEIEYAFF